MLLYFISSGDFSFSISFLVNIFFRKTGIWKIIKTKKAQLYIFSQQLYVTEHLISKVSYHTFNLTHQDANTQRS